MSIFFFLTHLLKRLGQLLSRTHHDHLDIRSPFCRQWLQSSLHTAFCVNHQRALGRVRGVGTWQQSVGFVQESLCADSSFHCECKFLLYPEQHLKTASLIAQLVKNLPAMQETPVRFLGQEALLEKG